nr:MAG TPA: hypothetical protein [Caudoviricetes sp.]
MRNATCPCSGTTSGSSTAVATTRSAPPRRTTS